MSIPSNPFGMPPNIPPPEPAQPITPEPGQFPQSGDSLDPTGTWAAFLGRSGTPATPQDVKTFIAGMLKMFNVLIQQELKAAKKANEKLKRAAEGKE